MAENVGGGTKVLRGLVIAAVIVAAIVLLVVFWRQALDGLTGLWNYVTDRFPGQTGQRSAVILYLALSVLLGIVFSKAGHFTAFGIAMGLGPLLWFLFWEGFPPLGLKPTWTSNMGVDHLGPSKVILWAVVADVLVALVFMPLELWEKFRRRKRSLSSE
jgi:hypothetical protein